MGGQGVCEGWEGRIGGDLNRDGWSGSVGRQGDLIGRGGLRAGWTSGGVGFGRGGLQAGLWLRVGWLWVGWGRGRRGGCNFLGWVWTTCTARIAIRRE